MSEYLFPFQLFVRVAYAGSFSGAGRELGISQSSVSRIIAALEQDLGATLLTRTTREVTLTEAGASYLATVEPILAAFEEANLATRASTDPSGKLRIGLPSAVAIRKVVPTLAEFVARFPLLNVELVADQNSVEPSRERLDVVLSLGASGSSPSTIRLIDSYPRLLVASAHYLAHHGTPEVPVDLMRHSIIACPEFAGSFPWLFSRGGRSTSVKLEPGMTVNMSEIAITAAVNGVGIVSVGRWDCQRELECGALVQVLPDWDMEEMKLNAVFPAGGRIKPAARLFVEHLIQTFHNDYPLTA